MHHRIPGHGFVHIYTVLYSSAARTAQKKSHRGSRGLVVRRGAQTGHGAMENLMPKFETKKVDMTRYDEFPERYERPGGMGMVWSKKCLGAIFPPE